MPQQKTVNRSQQVTSYLFFLKNLYPKFKISQLYMLRAIALAPFMLMIMPKTSTAQQIQNPVKFKDFVFESVQKSSNGIYNATPGKGIKPKFYHFDFYEPTGDTTPLRPLIIWIHGGGFKFGRKTTGGCPTWGKTFARRGYVCASVNYRLSKKH